MNTLAKNAFWRAEIEEKEEDDEIIDDEYCDEGCQKKTHDSKKSFGSIERRKTTEVEDSVDDEVAQSWAKRYGGK